MPAIVQGKNVAETWLWADRWKTQRDLSNEKVDIKPYTECHVQRNDSLDLSTLPWIRVQAR
jgi:hypothetical protein